MITAGRSGADAAWVPGNILLDEQVVATVVLESLDIAGIELLAERSQLEQARHVAFALDLFLGPGRGAYSPSPPGPRFRYRPSWTSSPSAPIRPPGLRARICSPCR